MDSKKWWRLAMIGGGTAALILILYLLRAALLPVCAALVLAYLLDPVIDRLEARKVNRSAAILLLGGVVMVVIGALGIFFAVQAEREVVKLIRDLPNYLERIQKDAAPLIEKHLGIQVPKTYEEILADLRHQAGQIDPAALQPVSVAAGKLIKGITSRTLTVAGWFFGFLVVPVFLFYFLRDWDVLKFRATDYIPLAYRAYVVEKARQADEVLGAFLRGQLTVCVTLGVLYSLGLLLVGVDLAVVIGMSAGIGFIVPYMGTAIGVTAGTIMALLEFGFGWQVLGVWAVFLAVQIFEGTILTPRVMGKKVGLSPVVVIIALLVGADLLGFLGLLVAVPAAAVINVFLKDAIARYQKSTFFLDPPTAAPPSTENS